MASTLRTLQRNSIKMTWYDTEKQWILAMCTLRPKGFLLRQDIMNFMTFVVNYRRNNQYAMEPMPNSRIRGLCRTVAAMEEQTRLRLWLLRAETFQCKQ